MAAMYFLTGLLQLLAFATADETGKEMSKKVFFKHRKLTFKNKLLHRNLKIKYYVVVLNS